MYPNFEYWSGYQEMFPFMELLLQSRPLNFNYILHQKDFNHSRNYLNVTAKICVAMSFYESTMISKLLTATMSIECPLAKMLTMDANLV